MLRLPPPSTLFPYTTLFRSDVSTRRVTAAHYFQVFGVWLGLVMLYAPLAYPVLYPLEYSCDAIPKYLSRKIGKHTSELQSLRHLVCRLLLEKKKKNKYDYQN